MITHQHTSQPDHATQRGLEPAADPSPERRSPPERGRKHGAKQVLPRCLAAAAALALLPACGSFHREWRQAVADMPAERADFTGPWTGTWHSEPTGHSGRLRAIITPAEDTEAGQPGAYDFHYHATWATILRGSFRARFEVTESETTPGAFQVVGDHKLNRHGRYRQDATLTPETYDATYDASIDHGTMVLRRP